MRAIVENAIRAAYVDTRRFEDPEYRVIAVHQVEEVIRDIRTRCKANVSVTADANYSTSYLISVRRSPIPTPEQIAEHPDLEQYLPSRYHGLILRISWLGPFAMKYWNAFARGENPQFMWQPATPDDKTLEECVGQILEWRGIQILTAQEQEQPVPWVNITLPDNATMNVRHLLFGEYM